MEARLELVHALGAAIEACEGWVDPAPLRSAHAALLQPWRVAIVGRVAAGKSTLLNAIVGDTVQLAGLGGITRAIAEIPHENTVLIDTPGIDDADQAVILLQPLMERVDAVLWVVDGLQPATASERDVLSHTLLADTPLAVVVSKRDLIDDAEVDAVVQRVRGLATAWAPAHVEAHDLRSASRSPATVDLGHLVAPTLPGRRRLARVAEAVSAVRAALAPQHRPPELEGLLHAWTAAVRGAVASVEREIEQGRIQHKAEALAALGGHAPAVAAAIQAILGPHAPPRLPSPDPPSVGVMDQVLGSLSGQEGAIRVLKAGAARWLAEGQITLREWWAEQPALQHRAHTRRVLEGRLEALGAVI